MNEQTREHQLVMAAKGGDEEAFAALVRLYEKRVFALAVRMCGSREDAAEAAGPSLDDEGLSLDVPDTALSPQDEAERQELREAIDRGLAALSPEHRQILILREMHQLSYDEIAEALSLDTGTVKSRISRARRQLRNFLLKDGNFSPPAASKATGKEG